MHGHVNNNYYTCVQCGLIYTVIFSTCRQWTRGTNNVICQGTQSFLHNNINDPNYPITYQASITIYSDHIWTSGKMLMPQCVDIPVEFYHNILCSPFNLTLYLTDSFEEEIQAKQLEISKCIGFFVLNSYPAHLGCGGCSHNIIIMTKPYIDTSYRNSYM